MSTGFASLGWQHLVMIAISLILMYLAIEKKFEPMLLLPISFECSWPTCPQRPTASPADGTAGGLCNISVSELKQGSTVIVFFGVGAMTDFGHSCQSSTMLLGAAASQAYSQHSSLSVAGIPTARIGMRGVIGAATARHPSTSPPSSPAPFGTCCRGRLLLHGACADHHASHNAAPHHERRALRDNDPIASGVKNRRILFPIITTVIAALLLPSTAGLIGSLRSEIYFGNQE